MLPNSQGSLLPVEIGETSGWEGRRALEVEAKIHGLAVRMRKGQVSSSQAVPVEEGSAAKRKPLSRIKVLAAPTT
jgi:hypothetical protein